MDSSQSAEILSRIHRSDVLGLTRELASIPSFTGEEADLARHLDRFFRQRGFESSFQELEAGGGQVIARLRGTGGSKSLMLNGHIDMDPLLQRAARDPWRPALEGDRLFGAGIGNMKAGVAAMISAALAVEASNIALRGDVVLACVAGELRGGLGTLHMLRSGVRSDAAIVPEPQTLPGNNVVTEHCGVIQFAVHIAGVARHTANRTGAVNALHKGFKAVSAIETMTCSFDQHESIPDLPKVNVGGLVAGRGRGVAGVADVPDLCTIYVDVRFTRQQAPQRIRQCVLDSLDAIAIDDPEFRYELEFPRRQVMDPLDVPRSADIVQLLARRSEEITGVPPIVGSRLPDSYFGTDAGHLWSAGIPSCYYGYGMGIDPESGVDKFVDFNEVMTVTKVLALAIGDFCG